MRSSTMRGGEAGRYVIGFGKPRAAGAAAARGARRRGGAARPGRRHHGRQRQTRGAPRHATAQARRQGNTTPNSLLAADAGFILKWSPFNQIHLPYFFGNLGVTVYFNLIFFIFRHQNMVSRKFVKNFIIL